MSTVEQTGGGCTADVLRTTLNGQLVVVVITDGNQTALSESELSPAHAVANVGVYSASGWDGYGDDTDPLSYVEGDVSRLPLLIEAALVAAAAEQEA